MTIAKLLVANRGEIARRIFRTCRDMGIQTVAVYSGPDAGAPFVREADEAVPIGGDSPASSYLRGDAVVEAAVRSGADAVHPGYGFLSENAAFATQVIDAGLTWVGPPPAAIEAMGSKISARELMITAGVPVLPGVDLSSVSDEKLPAAAESIGWPLLVKASAGGGGRGMRLVRSPDELVDAVHAARREAASAFGDDAIFVERFVEQPRHIEVQVLADTLGNVVHLFERECSIQRRHQKIVEEAPSPFIDADLRQVMGDAAVLAARTIGYVGAGTVEFIVAPSSEFFFLEMNTRLQVEHPVTELVTGLDLVRLQLLVAQGRVLPEEAVRSRMNGHAIEVRLYAEDTDDDYRPAPGTIDRFRFADAAGIRVDSGVEDGDVITSHYDPMLAKVIAHGADRHEATRRLRSALCAAQIHGIVTNRDLLVGILDHPEFVAGHIDTAFLDRHPPHELTATRRTPAELHLAAVAAAVAGCARNARDAPVLGSVPRGWRNNRSQLQTRRYESGDEQITVGYALGRDARLEVDGNVLADVAVVGWSPDLVHLMVNGVLRPFAVAAVDDRVHVDSARANIALREVSRFPDHTHELLAGSLTVPMPGTVVRVEVDAGDRVTAGQLLVVVEAMKMEHQTVAPANGVVAQVLVSVGQSVDAGTVLIVLEEPEHE